MNYKINNKKFSDIESPFIEVQICGIFLSRKVNILIDYGQEDGKHGRKTRLLREENGNDARFESNMDALNFLIRSGYDLIHAHYFQDSTGSQSDNVTLLMKNRKYKPETEQH